MGNKVLIYGLSRLKTGADLQYWFLAMVFEYLCR